MPLELRAVEPEYVHATEAIGVEAQIAVDEVRTLFASGQFFPFQQSSRVRFESSPEIQARGEIKSVGLPRFSCEPYDGGPMPWKGLDAQMVVDLETVNVPPTLVVFREQDTGQIVGHAVKGEVRISPSGIKVSGVFSGTYGPEIVSTGKNGFPWFAQLAATFPQQLELLAAGDSQTINGRNVKGPLYISRYQTVRALAFSVFATGHGQDVSISPMR